MNGLLATCARMIAECLGLGVIGLFTDARSSRPCLNHSGFSIKFSGECAKGLRNRIAAGPDLIGEPTALVCLLVQIT